MNPTWRWPPTVSATATGRATRSASPPAKKSAKPNGALRLAWLAQPAAPSIDTATPSPAVDSAGYKRLAKFLGTSDLDPYSCQCHDHASLVVLAIAKAKGEATGTAIKDHVRKISQGGGTKVDNAVDGLKLLAQGKEINFEGASGPCDFTDTGDIIDCKIRFDQAEKGKFKSVGLL